MRYPKFLEAGGRIGFIAPSFGCAAEPYRSYFENTKKTLLEKGYKLIFGPNVYEAKGIGKSNTPMACAEEINDYLTSPEADVIISCGGGETMCEDLPFVDFEAIRTAEPKWYMGYSDNTNLTFTLPTLCDTAAIYGPCAASFGMEPWHKSIEDAMNVLTGKNMTVGNYDQWEKEDKPEEDQRPLEPYNTTEPFAMRIFDSEREIREAQFSGRLLGGCLDCLSVLCGTRFDKVEDFSKKYKNDGLIWFLEACELTPMGIRRALWQLENAGWFENVKGFLIGRPMLMDADGMGLDRFSAVTGILSKYNVPIVMDIDIGHLPPMMPIISGALAEVKAGDNKLSVQFFCE